MPTSTACEIIDAIIDPDWLTRPMDPCGNGSVANATEEVSASFACGLTKPRQFGPDQSHSVASRDCEELSFAKSTLFAKLGEVRSDNDTAAHACLAAFFQCRWQMRGGDGNERDVDFFSASETLLYAGSPRTLSPLGGRE
jgi:hypothetical protein